MKWEPLTDKTVQHLQHRGYTHFVVKNATANEQLETKKDFITLEAVRNVDNELNEVVVISDDTARTFLDSDTIDYYVTYK